MTQERKDFFLHFFILTGIVIAVAVACLVGFLKHPESFTFNLTSLLFSSGWLSVHLTKNFFEFKELLRKEFYQRIRWLREGVLKNNEVPKILEYASEHYGEYENFSWDSEKQIDASDLYRFLDFYNANEPIRNVIKSARDKIMYSSELNSLNEELCYDKYAERYKELCYLEPDLIDFLEGRVVIPFKKAQQ